MKCYIDMFVQFHRRRHGIEFGLEWDGMEWKYNELCNAMG